MSPGGEGRSASTAKAMRAIFRKNLFSIASGRIKGDRSVSGGTRKKGSSGKKKFELTT